MRLTALVLAAAVVAPAAGLEPFEMVWQPGKGVLADLSFLHETPAGKHGFVTVRDGHLAKGNGERLRIWGVNFSFTASLPAKELAADVAAHLARFGINCVRVHHLDWRTPRGIIDSRFPDSRHLDPDMLDRLDFLIAELKKRGIYTNLNLNVARAFQEADGVKDAGSIGYAKALTYFDPRIIELQKEYAKTLLAHRNPYTGNEYRNEPAIVMVEIVNENSLIESWVRGRLQGRGAGKGDATWSDIPASYARDLTTLYNSWLPKNVGASELAALRGEAGGQVIARLGPKEFAAASRLRFDTEARFYMDLESRFFDDMYVYLRDRLGVRMPIVGTSVHAGGLTPYPLLSSTSRLDVVDAHTYWQHPAYLSDPATGKRTGFEIRNTPAVNEPLKLPFVTLSRAAVAGKPFMVSEVNHPYPNEYAAEAIPMLAAYGAFQDWDAVFWYSFEHGAAETWNTPKLPGHFDMRQNPVKMAQWAAAALTFLRGDIRPAMKTYYRAYSSDDVRRSLLLPSTEMPLFTPGLQAALPLMHGIRVSSFTAPQSYRAPRLAAEPPYRTDTGEIEWKALLNERGLVRVDTDRTQSLIGWLSASGLGTKNLLTELSNEFCAITLVSLDAAPIGKAQRLLLVTGARVGNTEMKWNEARTSLTNPGRPGMQIEVVRGTLTLREITANSVEVVALDGGGRALGSPASAKKTAAGWEFTIGEKATPWYLIQLDR